MTHKFLAAGMAMVLSFGALPAFAADPISGHWLTEKGQTAEIAPCENGFCITLATGPRAGTEIGQVALDAPGRYKGMLGNPETGKSVKAKIELADDALTLSACLNALMCQSQNWTRAE